MKETSQAYRIPQEWQRTEFLRTATSNVAGSVVGDKEAGEGGKSQDTGHSFAVVRSWGLLLD